jgi:hypothetical protein
MNVSNKQWRKKANLFGFFVLGITLFCIYFVYLQPSEYNPRISKGATKCNSSPNDKIFPCFVSLATEHNDPNICNQLGPATDDYCMQKVYEKINDPFICEQISKAGVKEQCKKYFQ